ncbi:MAG: hypothetical protein JWR26_1827 [Pedosphaera sp.]|nr:hypothetical protein [Pedosphaera sp.]
MNKTYVIYWKSRTNGRTGIGTTLFVQEEAERLAEELNRDYPEIEHFPINTEDAALGSVPIPLPIPVE